MKSYARCGCWAVSDSRAQPIGLQEFSCRLYRGSLWTALRPFSRFRDREPLVSSQPPALGLKMVRVEGCKPGEGEHVLTSTKCLRKLWNWAVLSFLAFSLFSCFKDLQTENAMNGNCCALFSWLDLGGWIMRACQCHHRPSVAYPGAAWSVQPLVLPTWDWFLWSGKGSPNPLPKWQEGLLGYGCRALFPTAPGRFGDVYC